MQKIEKKPLKYIKEITPIIVIVIFLLSIYAYLVNLSYQANTVNFFSLMVENHKEKIKDLVDNTVEQILSYVDQIDVATEEVFKLLSDRIDLAISTNSTPQQQIDELFNISTRYSSAVISIWDKKSDALLYQIQNGEMIETRSAESLEEFISCQDVYKLTEFDDGDKFVIIGYNYENIYELSQNMILEKVIQSPHSSGQYSIVRVDELSQDTEKVELLYSPITHGKSMESIWISTDTQDLDEQNSLQEILDIVREDGSGFTQFNSEIPINEYDNSSIVYSAYVPEFKWIISAGTSRKELVDSAIVEFDDFKQSTNVQINLALIIAGISFLMALLGGCVSFKFIQSKEIEYERQRNRIIADHNKVLTSKNEQINQNAHDIKNHLISIKGLIEMKHYESATTYIDSVYQDIYQLSDLVRTGNRLMDIILCEKISQMKLSNITFKREIEKVNLDFIDTKDLTVILTNLFDNAIESCEKSEQKLIEFNLYNFNGGFLVIKIRNSCDIKPVSVKGKLRTTKTSKYSHGYGVQNIIRTVRKYKGETLWEYDETNKLFCFVITIPIPPK